MRKAKKPLHQFQVGDYVQFKNEHPKSYVNKPTEVLAILPSGLIQHGTPTCFHNSSPLDLVLADEGRS